MTNNKVEIKEGISGKYLIIGGVIIAICGVGAYYIWSRNELINELIRLVEDYRIEYEEFMVDGELSPDEQVILDEKKLLINTLMKEIESKGLIGTAIDALWAIGIVITIFYISKIIYKIVDNYLKRHPPPGAPPGKNYKDVTDNTWHPTDQELIDHFYNTHPVPGEDPSAWEDIRKDIESLPDIATGILAGIINGLEEWIESGEMNPIIQFGLGAALLLLAAIIGWALGPAFIDKVTQIISKIDAIPG